MAFLLKNMRFDKCTKYNTAHLLKIEMVDRLDHATALATYYNVSLIKVSHITC